MDDNCCCVVVGDVDVVGGSDGTGDCCVVEGVSVEEVVVVAWFVAVEGELEDVVPVLVGDDGEEEGAVVETDDIDAVSLESCPDDSSISAPNVSNGV